MKATIKNCKIVFENPAIEMAELYKFPDGCEVEVIVKKVVKTRTSLQNASLHKWMSLLADALNLSGQDMRKTIRQDIDISWTEYNIKEYLFKPMMKAMYGKESTTQLSTVEIQKVYELVDKTIAERTGVTIPWPNIDQMLREQDFNNK